MNTDKKPTIATQHDLDMFVGKLLRYGCYAACIITMLGGIIYLVQHGGTLPEYSNFGSGTADYLCNAKGIFQALLRGDGAAIIQFGVAVLIATPILRVAFSALAFFYEKDYLYVVITLIVLAIILANTFFGWH